MRPVGRRQFLVAAGVLLAALLAPGQASGPHDTQPDLGSKSGTLSRPVLFHYTAERAVLNEIAGNVFRALKDGTLRVEVRHRYALGAAAEAHRDLEARRTTGSIVLLP